MRDFQKNNVTNLKTYKGSTPSINPKTPKQNVERCDEDSQTKTKPILLQPKLECQSSKIYEDTLKSKQSRRKSLTQNQKKADKCNNVRDRRLLSYLKDC